ncbi:hypothetical protein AURDEDRAFT_176466 [Auricularia subglabra TFB-10046 SS5]|nr:hypothetical protein AURDEDRAFT_176466 [Auricularia subglabra TFB-10046 SS5]
MLSLFRASGRMALRSFSTSAPAQKYKLKTHSGTKKRFKALPSGLFKRGQPGRVHNNTPSCRENRKPTTTMATPSQAWHLRKLMPYG